MIPSQFEYEAPVSVEDAMALLADDERDVKVLAGGQSLLPVLKLRMADPELVVSLSKIAPMHGVRLEGQEVVIGAMTTHHEVSRDPILAQRATLVSQAAATIADPQVRHRGTIGGAVVHADPAGDMPAALLAADAQFTIAGPTGTRTVPARDFFVDFFTTDVDEDELLTEIRVPDYTGWSAHYEKFNRVAQQWSIVAAAAMVRLDGGSIAEARVALTNMDSVPRRADAVEQALAGCAVDPQAIASACAAAAEGTNPTADLNGDEAYRRHLATVLTKRAVLAAAGA